MNDPRNAAVKAKTYLSSSPNTGSAPNGAYKRKT
jgi:hypothetical protein